MLSLKFLKPWMLISGFLPLAMLLILYLLKMRRREVEVSAVFLWRRCIEDMRANAPFQRLRMNLLFWLQVAVITVLTLALAQPSRKTRHLRGRTIVLVIDCSASMAVLEKGKSRLRLASKEAQKLVDTLSSGDWVLIISYAKTARIELPATTDKFEAKRKLNTIKVKPLPSMIGAALKVAVSSAGTLPRPEIHVFSDGVIADLSEINLNRMAGKDSPVPPIKFHKVGDTGDNAGITSVDLRKSLAETGRYELFVGIRNFGRKPFSGDLGLFVEGSDEPSDLMPVQLAPGAGDSRIFEFSATTRVGLVLKLSPEDAFPMDNKAFLFLQDPGKTKVLLVTPGNFFLEQALEADSECIVEVVKPARMPAARAALDEWLARYGVVIFDQVSPESLPSGRYMFINTVPGKMGWDVSRKLVSPVVVDWNTTHPVMRFVSLWELVVSEAHNFSSQTGATSLIESDGGPLAVAYEGAAGRWVVLAFDLYKTNLPLLKSFPVFVTNTLRWLVGGRGKRAVFTARTGETAKLTMKKADAEKDVILVAPSGRKRRVAVRPGGQMLLPMFDELGFYTLIVGEEKLKIGVNLSDARESDIAPHKSLRFRGGMRIKAWRSGSRLLRYWRFLAALALCFLMVEWFIYIGRVRLV